jgi:hypothetical protein
MTAKIAEMRDVQAAARSLGLEITVVDANGESEIDAAFASLARDKLGALIINTDPLLLGQRQLYNLRRVTNFLRCISCASSSMRVA